MTFIRDGSSDVWQVEFHQKREFLHNLTDPIEGAYDLLDQFQPLWKYAAGQGENEEGLFDGWLRYVVPSDDSNRTRWPLHPAWVVVQSAFTQSVEAGLGSVVRQLSVRKTLSVALPQ